MMENIFFFRDKTNITEDATMVKTASLFSQFLDQIPRTEFALIIQIYLMDRLRDVVA
jgi:hypothetical protein